MNSIFFQSVNQSKLIQIAGVTSRWKIWFEKNMSARRMICEACVSTSLGSCVVYQSIDTSNESNNQTIKEFPDCWGHLSMKNMIWKEHARLKKWFAKHGVRMSWFAWVFFPLRCLWWRIQALMHETSSITYIFTRELSLNLFIQLH